MTAVSVSCVPEFSGERLTGLELACRLSLRAEESWGEPEPAELCAAAGEREAARISAALEQLKGWNADCLGLARRAGQTESARWNAPPVAGGVSGTGDPGDSTGFAAGGLRREKGIETGEGLVPAADGAALGRAAGAGGGVAAFHGHRAGRACRVAGTPAGPAGAAGRRVAGG